MNLPWITVRASGLVAYALLASATVWGLVMSSKSLQRAVSTKNTTYVHESLSIGSLLATAVHVAALLLDDYVDFGWRQILIPGASDWRPAAVSIGVLALYGMMLTTSTFYIRQHIGQKAWRNIHYLTYGTFTAAAVHGILAGADSHGVFAVALYGGTALIVAAFTVIRVLAYAPRGRQARKANG